MRTSEMSFEQRQKRFLSYQEKRETEARRKHDRIVKRAKNPIVRVVQVHTNFSGAWGVPRDQRIELEGRLSSFDKFMTRDVDLEKVYDQTSLIRALNKSMAPQKKRAQDDRQNGYSSSGYSTFYKPSKTTLVVSEVKEQDDLKVTIFEIPKSAF